MVYVRLWSLCHQPASKTAAGCGVKGRVEKLPRLASYFHSVCVHPRNTVYDIILLCVSRADSCLRTLSAFGVLWGGWVGGGWGGG